MAFCANCGTKIEDGVKFCPSCGGSIGSAAPIENKAAAPVYTPPVLDNGTAKAAVSDAEENKTMGILAYLIVLIPLLAAPKNSKFCRFHNNQGLILLLLCLAWGVVYTIITSMLTAISWRLGLSVGGILSLVYWVFPVYCVIGIVNVCKGQMKELPIIGKFRILK